MAGRSLPRRLASLIAAAMILWLVGLAAFVGGSLAIQPDAAARTDAIVVLTGGRLRLETGLQLLAAGMAEKLFVSGVDPRVDRTALLHALGAQAEREACCIVLGHEADNTFENAQETANWMHSQGYRSLRLVTSWYHMRRSLLEFGRAMPHLQIVPHPVYAPHLAPEHWWNRHGAPLLVIGEYHKYVAAWLRPLIELFHPPPPPPMPPVRNAGMPAQQIALR